VRAIIDGATDRLRPVLLTTLTTVLGLAPLLYESSSQALFLKPTVISLVYGLGFGMVLVLLLVPALLAAQFDIARAMRSARRAFGAGRASGGLRGVTAAVAAALAAWFAATLGHALVTGGLPGPVAAWLAANAPALAGRGAVGTAFGLFLGGAAVLTLGVYLMAGLAAGLRRARRPAA
jgi:hypothetical protein